MTLTEGLKTIGEYAFYDCDHLTEIAVPDSVTQVGTSAFSSCDRLERVTLGSSLQTIGVSAFDSCPKLRSVTFEGALPEEIDGDSILGNEAPLIYEVHNGERFWIGFFNGEAGVPLMRLHSEKLSDFLQTIDTIRMNQERL